MARLRGAIALSASLTAIVVGCGLVAELETHGALDPDASISIAEASAVDAGETRPDGAEPGPPGSCDAGTSCPDSGSTGTMCETFEGYDGTSFAPWLTLVARPAVDAITLLPVEACARRTNAVRVVSSAADAGAAFGVHLERRLQGASTRVTRDVYLSFLIRVVEAGGARDRGWALTSLVLGGFGTEPETSWYSYELHTTPERMRLVQVAPDPASSGSKLRAEKALLDPVSGEPFAARLGAWHRVRLHVHTQAPASVSVRLDDGEAAFYDEPQLGANPPPKPLLLRVGQWNADPPAGRLVVDYDDVRLDWD